MDEMPHSASNNIADFMGQLRTFIRVRDLAYKTEKTYSFWVEQYIRYYRMRNPREMSEKQVEQFLNYLAVVKGFSPATQKTARNALFFLYK